MIRLFKFLVCLVPLLPAGVSPTLAQDSITSSQLGGVGGCLPPEPPYPYKLAKTDPLYETARLSHQQHMEGLEEYLNCIERERERAYEELEQSFDLFVDNFGDDAVLRYAIERDEE